MYSKVFLSSSSLLDNIKVLKSDSSPFHINRDRPALPVPPPPLVWTPFARPHKFEQEGWFWSSFAGFEVKVKFSFCCQHFQFL